MDTAAGIGKAFAENNFYVALGMSAGIAANGMAQISAINGAGGGGGSVSTGGTSIPAISAPPTQSLDRPSANVSNQQVQHKYYSIYGNAETRFTVEDVKNVLNSALGDHGTVAIINDTQAAIARDSGEG